MKPTEEQLDKILKAVEVVSSTRVMMIEKAKKSGLLAASHLENAQALAREVAKRNVIPATEINFTHERILPIEIVVHELCEEVLKIK